MMIWHLAIGMALVVAVVVVVLLAVIRSVAHQIETTAETIWNVGTHIAANTVHVPDLGHTNVHVAKILAAAPALVASLERIRTHAEQCPSCPQCILGGGR